MTKLSRKSAIKTDIFQNVLTLNFSNGNSLEIDVTKLSPEIQRQAMLHGIKQKLVDAAAISTTSGVGFIERPTIETKYNAVKEIYDRITSPNGTWNKQSEHKTNTPGKGNLLVRALMKMTGKDKDYVDDFLSAKTKEERTALQRNPRVLQIIAELQSQQGTGDVDTDALLGELGADAQPTAEQVPEQSETVDEPVKTVRARKSKKEPVVA